MGHSTPHGATQLKPRQDQEFCHCPRALESVKPVAGDFLWIMQIEA